MADEPKNWTEHTHNDGRRYYYNKATKASSWDKPECLKSDQEKANTTSWKEYKTAEGRDYFFNPVTKQSVWEMPIELKRLRGLAQQQEEESEEEQEKEEEAEWKTPEERRAAFQALLTDKGAKASMKWEEALKLIQEDPRFNALNTAGERKQEFSIWVNQSKKREKEEEREKKKQAKDDFSLALTNWKELKVTSRYKDAAEAFYQEEWFKLMEEDDRDELFQDFMDEYEKKSKEDRRKQRKDYVEKIKKTYDEHEKISVTSRWKDVQDLLRDDDTFRWLSKLEALTSWEEWVAETEKKEVQTKSVAQFRHSRKSRDSFRELLQELYDVGKLKGDSSWRHFVRDYDIADKTEYLGLVGMGGSTPHDLFDDFLEELENKYNTDRAKIKKYAKAASMIVTSSSTFEWFEETLSKEEGYKQIPEDTRRQVFESLHVKAKEQDEAQEKLAKKNRKKFVELLQKTREVTAKTNYEQAEKMLKSKPEWDTVEEDTRKQCFSIFVDQLKIQTASRKKDNEASEEDDGSDAGAKKKPKKVEKAEKVEKADKAEKGKKRKEVAEEEPAEEPEKKAKKHKKK